MTLKRTDANTAYINELYFLLSCLEISASLRQ